MKKLIHFSGMILVCVFVLTACQTSSTPHYSSPQGHEQQAGIDENTRSKQKTHLNKEALYNEFGAKKAFEEFEKDLENMNIDQ